MKGKELLENYPKVAKPIREYFLTKMMESMVKDIDIPEDFKNAVKERGVPDELIANIIDKNPAALFEIFDGLHTYIEILVDKVPDTDKIVFNYRICSGGISDKKSTQNFPNRKDVSYAAMIAAVEYLENTISES